VPDAAPRIHHAVLAALERLDDERLPIAEVHRRVAAVAEIIGCSRPSYEQVRVLVHVHRRRRLQPTAGQILLAVASRGRPPEALLDLLEGA
jgi:hypothetical protein